MTTNNAHRTKSWMRIAAIALLTGVVVYGLAAFVLSVAFGGHQALSYHRAIPFISGPTDTYRENPIRFGGVATVVPILSCAVHPDRKEVTVGRPAIIQLRISTCSQKQKDATAIPDPVFFPDGGLLQATLTSPSPEVEIEPDKHNMPQPGPPPDPSWGWSVTISSAGEYDLAYNITALSPDGKTEQFRNPAIPFTLTAKNPEPQQPRVKLGDSKPEDDSLTAMIIGKDGVVQSIAGGLGGAATLGAAYFTYKTSMRDAANSVAQKKSGDKPGGTPPKKKATPKIAGR